MFEVDKSSKIQKAIGVTAVLLAQITNQAMNILHNLYHFWNFWN